LSNSENEGQLNKNKPIKENELMQKKLIDCKAGIKVRILEINAGRGAEMNLMNLGLSIGNIIEIIKVSHLHGPIIVLHNDTEVAIGHGLAEKIFVEGT